MAHICQLLVADHQHGIGRIDEQRRERYDAYDLEQVIIYCEDLLEAGHACCPVDSWDLAAMLSWARQRLRTLALPA